MNLEQSHTEPESFYGRKLREDLKTLRIRQSSLWNKAVLHSQQYEKALGITEKDLEEIEQLQVSPVSMNPSIEDLGEAGFLKIPVENEWFGLRAENVCGVAYDNKWSRMIYAICVSNKEINVLHVGSGTTLITIIAKDWHDKLMDILECPNKPENMKSETNVME